MAWSSIDGFPATEIKVIRCVVAAVFAQLTPRIHQKRLIGFHEVQPQPSRLQSRQKDATVLVGSEPLNRGIALLYRHATIETHVIDVVIPQYWFDFVEHGRPLRENDRFGGRILAVRLVKELNQSIDLARS